GTVRVDHPGGHVVDRDEGRSRGAGLGQLLENDRRIETGEAGAADILADIEPAEAELRGFHENVARKDVLLIPFIRIWSQMLGSETRCDIAEGTLFLTELEIHRHRPCLCSSVAARCP